MAQEKEEVISSFNSEIVKLQKEYIEKHHVKNKGIAFRKTLQLHAVRMFPTDVGMNRLGTNNKTNNDTT